MAAMGVPRRSRLNLEDQRLQAKRAAQCASVANELRRLPANLPFVAAGDGNSFAREISLTGVANLTAILPSAGNYAGVFDGQTPTRDHILLSRVHFAIGNADFPAAKRLSNHRGVVAYLARPAHRRRHRQLRQLLSPFPPSSPSLPASSCHPRPVRDRQTAAWNPSRSTTAIGASPFRRPRRRRREAHRSGHSRTAAALARAGPDRRPPAPVLSLIHI
jgi:hypothetical protein